MNTDNKLGNKENEERLSHLVDILQYPSLCIQEFLDYALSRTIELTSSKIGYIYHYSEEKKQFILNTWSKEVMKACSITNPETVYQLDRTGIWGEAVRQRKPIIINNFKQSHPLKKGYPEGHVELENFLTIPVIKNEKIIGVVGLANKETDYTGIDVLQATLLMEAVFNVTETKKAENT